MKSIQDQKNPTRRGIGGPGKTAAGRLANAEFPRTIFPGFHFFLAFPPVVIYATVIMAVDRKKATRFFA